eukprot:GDKK01045510.1.p1 GENE.GDKK01045510.1~~GDKK01045510.1.p1  ORF type:complete len:103 (-),score=16.51 GDKK01045510.1:255-563(-)
MILFCSFFFLFLFLVDDGLMDSCLFDFFKVMCESLNFLFDGYIFYNFHPKAYFFSNEREPSTEEIILKTSPGIRFDFLLNCESSCSLFQTIISVKMKKSGTK